MDKSIKWHFEQFNLIQDQYLIKLEEHNIYDKVINLSAFETEASFKPYLEQYAGEMLSQQIQELLYDYKTSRGGTYYVSATSLIQSSGFGKTRSLEILSTLGDNSAHDQLLIPQYFVFYLNLNDEGKSSYPARTRHFADYLLNGKELPGRIETKSEAESTTDTPSTSVAAASTTVSPSAESLKRSKEGTATRDSNLRFVHIVSSKHKKLSKERVYIVGLK